MLIEKAEQIIEETPYRIVLYQVMAQYAGRFVEVAIAGASCHKMLNQYGNSRIQTEEAALVAPIHRIKMSVDLQEPGCRPGITAYAHGRNAAKTEPVQGLNDRRIDSIPGWHQYGGKTFTKMISQQPLTAAQIDKNLCWIIVATEFQLPFTGHGVVLMSKTVLQNINLRMGLQPRRQGFLQ